MKSQYFEILISSVLIAFFVGFLYFSQSTREEVLGPDSLQRMLEGGESSFLGQAPLEDTEAANFAQLRVDSESLESDSRRARAEGQLNEAVEALAEAIRLQEQINRDAPASSYSDRRRVTSLRRELANWEAEPLHRLVMSLQQDGQLALDRSDYEEAAKAFLEAVSVAREINEEHTRSRFYDPTLVRNLERSVERAQVLPMLGEQEAWLDRARVAAGQEEFAQVREAMQQVLAIQNDLAQQFPNHPAASEENRENLLREKDILLGTVIAERFEERFQAMQEAFAERDFSRGEEIAEEVFGLFDVLRLDFPRGGFPSPERAEDTEFLKRLASSRSTIAEEIWQDLRTVPGYPVKMLVYEVPQSLYERVIGQNPSRNRGPNHPVDSLTFEEAKTFCTTLSLVMGKSVRLPRAEEFEAALGGVPTYDELFESSWHAGNSNGQSHQVRQLPSQGEGFYDLLGNVAQWIESGRPGEAQAIGGSYNDELSNLRSIPLERHPVNFRSRSIGFRFLVELE